MILPTKRLEQNRSLLYIGSEILRLLDEPKTVSRLWEELRCARTSHPENATLSYDWFVLSLDLLFVIRAVNYDRGRLEKASS
jgi:hypothetical protein